MLQGHPIRFCLLANDAKRRFPNPPPGKRHGSVHAAASAVIAAGSLSGLLQACIALTGDVDTVATIALAAGSCSAEVTQDLPPELISGLENGPYGRNFLADLDRRLMQQVG